MIYDIIIVGSGISALYLAYKLKNRKWNILVLEKNNYVGGRIKTFHISINNHKYQWEEGAGRFNDNHCLFIKLLHELQLKKYITKISSQINFQPSELSYKSKQSFINESPNKYLEKIIKYSDKMKKEELQSCIFKELANKVLTKDEYQFLLDSTGNYYTIFINMNAYEALKLFKFVVNEKVQYYGLQCGFDMIVMKLLDKIKKYNYTFQLNHSVTDIEYNQINTIFNIHCDKNLFQSKKVILTCPKPDLLKFKILRPIQPLLNSIKIKSLCRIYSIFKKKDIWFKDIGKTTTNNASRTFIPVDKENGVIMISYSDGKYADAWNKVKEEDLVTTLCKNVEKTCKIKIETPLFTKKSYWKVATAYWLKNIDSETISKKICKPFDNIPLYICGENYSPIQGWIEGALLTAENVVKEMKNN
jgi:protoporphyrinogen oxidase